MVSLLQGPKASTEQVMASMAKLKAGFPQMSDDFWGIMSERITKTGMTSQRLEYAVNRVLDTFTYKTLTIADVLSIDVKCRVLTYSEMCNEASRRGVSTDEYAPVRINGLEKPGWVLKVDKVKYNIPDAL